MQHDLTGCPSKITEQAPQTPCSQPTWVPVSAKSSRKKSTNVVLGSTSRWWGVPLTVI
jgi:hypothetical protein